MWAKDRNMGTTSIWIIMKATGIDEIVQGENRENIE